MSQRQSRDWQNACCWLQIQGRSSEAALSWTPSSCLAVPKCQQVLYVLWSLASGLRLACGSVPNGIEVLECAVGMTCQDAASAYAWCVAAELCIYDGMHITGVVLPPGTTVGADLPNTFLVSAAYAQQRAW